MHERTPGPRTGPHPMSARALAAALAERAEPFCRRYLPHGYRQGRYWFAGDLHGAPGRALWMCLAPPGHPGLWTDSATGRRGDALELLQLRLGDATLERAIAEARAFLASTGDAVPTMRRAPPPHALHHRAEAPVRLWNLCRPHPRLARRGLSPRARPRALRGAPLAALPPGTVLPRRRRRAPGAARAGRRR